MHSGLIPVWLKIIDNEQKFHLPRKNFNLTMHITSQKCMRSMQLVPCQSLCKARLMHFDIMHFDIVSCSATLCNPLRVETRNFCKLSCWFLIYIKLHPFATGPLIIWSSEKGHFYLFVKSSHCMDDSIQQPYCHKQHSPKRKYFCKLVQWPHHHLVISIWWDFKFLKKKKSNLTVHIVYQTGYESTMQVGILSWISQGSAYQVTKQDQFLLSQA